MWKVVEKREQYTSMQMICRSEAYDRGVLGLQKNE